MAMSFRLQVKTLVAAFCLLFLITPCFSQNVAPGCPAGSPLVVNGSATCVCPLKQYYKDGVCQDYQPTNADGDPVDEFYDFYFRPKYDVASFKIKQNKQTIFFVTAIVILLIWIALACSLRFLPIGDGKKPGGGFFFQVRWMLTRLDRRYHRKHWMDEQKVLIKRRTELGGTCSVASYIFTYGTMLGLAAQEFWDSRPLVQSLVANNGRVVAGFANYMQWDVTVISSMTCSQLVLSPTTYGSDITLRVFDEASVGATTQCVDGPTGPKVSIFCPQCQPVADIYTISFEFQNRPAQPALATGFEYMYKASKENGSLSRESVSYGSIKANGTLRGPLENVLWFRAIPRFLKDSHNLKLMQATFHDYLNGTVLTTPAELNASLADANETVKFVLIIQILSEYVVETDRNPYTFADAVAWLAAMGGLYQLGISLFYLLQLQVEIRVRGMAYDEKLFPLAVRVRKRKLLWKKVKYRMKALWLLTHWRAYKFQVDEEQRLLLDEVDALDKDKAARLQSRDSTWQSKYGATSKPKTGLYSGFLRRRPRRSDSLQPLVGSTSHGSGTSPDAWKGSTKDAELVGIRVDPAVRDEGPSVGAAPNEHDRLIESPTGVRPPAGQGSHSTGSPAALGGPAVRPTTASTAGSAPTFGAFPGAAAVGHSVGAAAHSVGHAANSTGSALLQGARSGGSAVGTAVAQAGQAVNRGIHTVVPFWPAGRDAAQVDGEAAPFVQRSLSSGDAVRQAGGEGGARPHLPLNLHVVGSSVGGLVHGAAQSLGSIAHNVRPRIPHVMFSGPLPNLHPFQRRDIRPDSPQPVVVEELQELEATIKKKKKRSKNYLTYGSNTTYHGMIVRDYRKPSWLNDAELLPAVPSIEEGVESDDDEEVDWDDILEYMKDMYEYNIRLRRDFLVFQTMIENTVQYFRPQSDL